MPCRICCLVFLLAAVAPLSAQSLLVNGQPSFSQAFLGQPLTLRLAAPPGVPHFWGVSPSGGPTLVSGISVPLGLGSGLIDLGQGLPFPASGVRTLSTVPTAIALTGTTLHSLAAIPDSSAPLGLAFSNPLSFTFLAPGVDAGPDGAMLVAETLILDGSVHADPSTGAALSGETLSWSVISTPPNGLAQLQGAATPFPTFSADTPGTYVVELSLNGPNGFGLDTMEVEVIGLSVLTPGQNAYSTASSVACSGFAYGPPGMVVTVNGAPTNRLGALYTLSSVPLTHLLTSLAVTATLPDGRAVSRASTVTRGVQQAFGAPCPSCTGLRFRQPALDALATQILPLVAALDLNAFVGQIPSVNVISNAPIASATVDLLGGSFNPNTVAVNFVPASDGVLATITLTNVVVNANVSGQLVFVNYTETATILAQQAVLTGRMNFQDNGQGGLEVALSNVNAQLVGFNFQLGGVLNTIAQIGLIQDAIRAQVEQAIEDAAVLLPDSINPLLADLALSTDLSAAGLPLALDFPLMTTLHDGDGVTFRNGFFATALSVAATAPSLSGFRQSPAALPSFAAVTPAGLPYGLAASISENLLNQSLAQIIRTGYLDLDLTGSLGSGPMTLPLDAQSLSFLIPNAGFESLPAATPITLRLRHTAAPFITLDPQSSGDGILHLGGIQVEFLAETTPGTFGRVLSLLLSGVADVAVQVDGLSNTVAIQVVPGSVVPVIEPSQAFPGTNPGPVLQSLAQVIDLLLPLLTEPLGMIPVPSTPIGSPNLLEVAVDPVTGSLLSFFELLP